MRFGVRRSGVAAQRRSPAIHKKFKSFIVAEMLFMVDNSFMRVYFEYTRMAIRSGIAAVASASNRAARALQKRQQATRQYAKDTERIPV
jgi:hypothetical protein